ncbi:hypothetical protein [Escherichia phage pEC-M2929-1AR.1]|nr:hypothetical protein [Escherichia phage pEC-M2929-1AR.1]
MKALETPASHYQWLTLYNPSWRGILDRTVDIRCKPYDIS